MIGNIYMEMRIKEIQGSMRRKREEWKEKMRMKRKEIMVFEIEMEEDLMKGDIGIIKKVVEGKISKGLMMEGIEIMNNRK